MCILQLASGQPEKRGSSTGLEVDSHDRRLAGRIDHGTLRMRPADQTAAKAVELVVILPVVDPKEIFAKVDDQLHRAIWKPAFLRVGQMVAFVQPELLHKSGQWHRWDVGAIDGQGSPPVHRTPVFIVPNEVDVVKQMF